jgi:hypothetical protein
MTAGWFDHSVPNLSCFPSESGNEISAKRLLNDVGMWSIVWPANFPVNRFGHP